MRPALLASALLGVGLFLLGGWWWTDAASGDGNPPHENGLDSGVRDRPCATADSQQGVVVRCFWVTVEEGVELSLAVISDDEQDWRTTAPLVYLPGGPGTQGNSDGDMLNYWRDWYAQADMARPFVILDYRYLSPSLPNFQCLNYRRTVQRILAANLTMSEEGEWLHPVFEACLAEARDVLGQQAADPVEHVNTATNAHDVHAALQRLGYREWHLLGVSYGTRVALYAAMSQSEVLTLILDSAYAFGSGRESDLASLWQSAFEAFFERCYAQQICQQLGVTEPMLYETLERLREDPLAVHSEYWQTEVIQSWWLNDVRLASFLFQQTYSSGTEETMARAIRSAHQGEIATPTALEIYYNSVLDPYFNEWIYLTTECADSPRDSASRYRQELAAVSEPWKTAFAGLDRFNSCESVPHNPLHKQMRPITQPALVIMGESDPITTQEQALTLKQWLKQGVFWDRKEVSHAESLTDECSLRVIQAFLDGVVDPVVESDYVEGC